MILFNAGADNLLTAIKEKPFKLEKDIQRLFELNLKQIMGLELVKSEFSVKNKRIDTLAFDPQSKAFAIIEYKRDRNASVFDLSEPDAAKQRGLHHRIQRVPEPYLETDCRRLVTNPRNFRLFGFYGKSNRGDQFQGFLHRTVAGKTL